ncbi:hypothetical protein KC953_00125 [Candidatus Saccharibacteria bacterium]|nr:hypothetical protein [Candidatus Saccharibacteria bacterium]
MSEKLTKHLDTHDDPPTMEQSRELPQEEEQLYEKVDTATNEEKNENQYKAVAQKLALEAEQSNKKNNAPDTSEVRRGTITKKQLNDSFKKQMKNVEHEMKITQRLTSRFIHMRAVDRGSEILSSTLARPNAMLYGSISAFIVVTVVYFVSKYYGFRITGFEAIGAFVFGWLLGISYDYITAIIRGKK